MDPDPCWIRIQELSGSLVIIVLKKYTVFKENCLYLKLFLVFSFKIDSITLDPNSMYLDPQHCSTLYSVQFETVQCTVRADVLGTKL